MSLKYRTSAGTSASNFSDLVVKVGDTLPIGTEVDYDGQTAPAGWQEVDDPNVYSTDETRIGTWIDGKPLYRKVISSTTPSQANTGTNIYDANSLNIDRIVNLSFNFKGTYNEYATASNVIIMFTRLEGTNRQIACTCTLSDYCNKPFYFILEYTKSTD